jgi:transglutaminase superfamily protein
MAAPTFTYVQPRLTPWPREISTLRRAALVGAALADLLWLDLWARLGFSRMHRAVARTAAARRASATALRDVRLAVRDACVFYFKPVPCLHRSAVVTRMLRRRGVDAQLVIGYQPIPPAFHAWVEVDRRVVWDQLDQLPFFRVLDRL